MGRFSDEQYLETARKALQVDGELEIDEGDPLPTSRVSNGDDSGAYVLAWVWVEDGNVEAVLDLPPEPLV